MEDGSGQPMGGSGLMNGGAAGAHRMSFGVRQQLLQAEKFCNGTFSTFSIKMVPGS